MNTTDDDASPARRSVDAICRERVDEPAISVVIPTYNRCETLTAVLQSVLSQHGNVAYDVLVVDNNSVDRTADVVHSYGDSTNIHLQYVRETRQGAAHARNAGLSLARAPIIAFIDDDGWAAPDWVATIKRVLDEHPEVEYLGGRVLPQWPGERPPWLTDSHWSPLAILDHGERPLDLSAKQPIVMLGANLAVRRTVFDHIGQFAADFQHLRDDVCGGTEDHELQMRIWATGGRGLYVPELVVTANIQPERLTRKYHRQWHATHGILCSRLRLDEVIGSTGELLPDRQDDLHLFGVPAWLYRAAIRCAASWLWAQLRSEQAAAFEHEMRVRYYCSYIRTRCTDTRAHRSHMAVVEFTRFLVALLRSRLRMLGHARSARRSDATWATSTGEPAAVLHPSHAKTRATTDGRRDL